MRDAHKRYRQGLRLGMGWTFGRCLSTAWAAAKQRQREVEAFKRAPIYRTPVFRKFMPEIRA